MINYQEDRYSLLNNLPVLKLSYGIGILNCNGPNDYFFTPKYNHLEMQYKPECKEVLHDNTALLDQFKVAHIGRRREVKHKGKSLINNIQCNYNGYAYTLPMGLKHMLNQLNIVPIIIIPNNIEDLNDLSKKEYRQLNVVNLKEMITSQKILNSIEADYYNILFKEHTADLDKIKPLGRLINSH